MDKANFIRQLDYFKENFNVVTMEQVIEAWNSPNGELPEKALLITFDDGYIDNYLTAFPLLKERGMQGSFFIPGKTITENVLLDVNKIHFILACAEINSLVEDLKKELDFYRGREFDFPSTEELWETYAHPNRFDKAETIFVKRVLQTALPEDLRAIIASKLFAKHVGIEEDKFARELYMNHEQIKLMQQNGMYIGLHGYDHYWMANLTPEELAKDTDLMLDAMSDFVDKKKWVLNYPYGNYSQSVIDYLESRGCVLGMTCEAKVGKIGVDSRFEIPRMDCNDYPPIKN
ncbi:MAG: polysaccharide deacetylase family protein [Pseudobutyrivibrio sp.]|nr:polysaccharide deacetylase family protein [Pseudobutyrivibrio sp.]